VVVPPELREYAGIDREAVVIGVHTSFEIWSPSGWEAMQALVDDEGDAIVSQLANVL
jgi:MraZ protein